MSLSDLELVQQAMASSEPANANVNSNANARSDSTSSPTTASSNNTTPNSTSGNSNGHSSSGADAPVPSAQPNAPSTDANANADSLAGIDLSQLTPADRAAVQPIIDALRAAGDGEGDVDVEDILKQLEAADDVADALEGRLDSLLASLGELEADVGAKGEEAK